MSPEQLDRQIRDRSARDAEFRTLIRRLLLESVAFALAAFCAGVVVGWRL